MAGPSLNLPKRWRTEVGIEAEQAQIIDGRNWKCCSKGGRVVRNQRDKVDLVLFGGSFGH
jgi:hypothetical protein